MTAKDAADRVEALRALGTLGLAAKDAVPAIVTALDDDETAVRIGALAALAQLGPEAKSAVPALLTALDDRDVPYRDAAIRALVAIGTVDDRVVPALAEVLIDPARRDGAALFGLQKLGPAAKAAIPILAKGLSSRDPGQRVHLVQVLGSIGPDAVPVLLDVWKKEEHPNVRLALHDSVAALGPHAKPFMPLLSQALRDGKGGTVRLLGAIGPDALPALLEAFADADPENVRAAGAVIGAMGAKGKPAIPTLIEGLKDPFTKRAATVALKGIGTEAVSALVAALSDGTVRDRVLSVLAEIGANAKAAVPALIRATTDNEPWAETAAIVLVQIGPAAVPAALEAAKDPNNKHMSEALRAMAYESRESAALIVPGLAKLLKDEEWVVRRRAAATLGRLGGHAKPAIPDLEAAAKDPQAAVRQAVQLALKNVGERK